MGERGEGNRKVTGRNGWIERRKREDRERWKEIGRDGGKKMNEEMVRDE